jgi:putative ABC transport system ATP-binding protein
VLKLEDVCKSYRNGAVEARALADVSLAIDEGEFLAVMGPSGCGKSTLLNLLGLLDRPSAGRVWFRGEDVTDLAESRLARLRKDAIGFIFQNFNLIEDLTVADNVEAPLIYSGLRGKERKSRVQEALELVGVAAQARLRPAQLSGGQQQRAAIARALVCRPQLLLADEPTGNLDTENGEAVMALLSQAAASGVTVVMATHSPAHAGQAQRVVRLRDGRIAAEPQVQA